MDIRVIVLLTAVAFYAVLWFIVLLKGPKNTANRIYAFHIFNVLLWTFGLAMFYYNADLKTALFWTNILYLAGSLIATSFLQFSFVFPSGQMNIPRFSRLAIYIPNLILFYLFFFTPLIIKEVAFINGEKGFIYGLGHILWDLQFYTIFLWAFWRFIKMYRNYTGIIKARLRYIIIGTATGVVFSGTTNVIMPWFNEFKLMWSAPLCSLIWLVCVVYAIVKYRLMDIRVAFTRAGIFLVVYTIVLGIPFIVLNRTGSGLLATSSAVIFATMGPLIYHFLQMKAEAVILAQQRRYQRILLQAANGMVTEHDLNKLSKLIVYILKNAILINFSAIFIKDTKKNSYQLKSIRGESNIGECVKSFDTADPFIGYLKENHGDFFFENAPDWIKDSSNILSKTKIVIPVLIGEELFGFVFLGEKTNTHPYSNEDINVFKILSRQVALAIENCIFFEESKDSQQRMFAAEKLASIGGMADGIAHQIKNRLNLFSLTGGELKIEVRNFVEKNDKLINRNPELNKTFKYLNKIAAAILDNVKRTDAIIKGILDFAKVENKENLFTVFSLKETIKLSSDLLMFKHETASIPLTVKIDNEDAIYGIKSQLTEVIYNLLDNAYEAVEERKMQVGAKKDPASFAPAIGLSLTHTQGQQIIKISDNGIGIKEEDKPRIFAPFFTTKTSYKSGSGIGVYVVKRIIEENHRGKIRFTSNYMEGTSFIIELPKKPEE